MATAAGGGVLEGAGEAASGGMLVLEGADKAARDTLGLAVEEGRGVGSDATGPASGEGDAERGGCAGGFAPLHDMMEDANASAATARNTLENIVLILSSRGRDGSLSRVRRWKLLCGDHGDGVSFTPAKGPASWNAGRLTFWLRGRSANPSPDGAAEIYGFVVIGNGVAFNQAEKTKLPLFARIR
jgi:hypothetical protein